MTKRSSLLIMVTAFIVALIFMNLCAYADEKKLSEMTEEECIEFAEAQEIEIPEEFINYGKLGNIIKDMIEYIELNPNAEHIYNYIPTNELYTNVRKAVFEYYNKRNVSVLKTYSRSAAITLQYSKALNSWKYFFENYNCYAYAISAYNDGWIKPGYKIGASYSESSIYNISIERFANLVASDLNVLGYTNVTYGSTRPAYQSGYRVLAIRKCDTDFHLMAETSSNVWKHKPGSSVELQYNYSSPALGKWTNEGIGRGGLQGGNIEYTSNIMYIKYKLK